MANQKHPSVCVACGVKMHGTNRPVCATCDREGREAAAKGDWVPINPDWRES